MSRCCVVVGRHSVYVWCRFSDVQDLSVVPLLGGTVSECCVVVRRYSI